MDNFRFAYPLVLLLLVLPISYYGLRRFYFRQPDEPALRYSDTRLLDDLPKSARQRLHWLPDMLRWLAWGLLVIGLARPQGGEDVDVIRGDGVDIVLALDISTSMSALDFQPDNRLETAKRVISDFIQGRTFDRIGLVVFARNAFQQAPLTLDYQVLLRLLDDVNLASQLRPVDGRQLDGTAIGLGIASSANMLRESDAPSKVIILLTDGANNAGLAPTQAAQAAATLGMRVYTIGMGRPGLVDAPTIEGEIITIESDLDEPTLREIAEIADGLYFRAENSEGLQQIYEQIDRLERSRVERRVFVRWQDYAFSVLVIALVVLLGERVLRQSVFQVVP